MQVNRITETIIGCAIEVHRTLGPGLLERTYEACLAKEFQLNQVPFDRQKRLNVTYKGLVLPHGYRLDLLVAQTVVVEIKTVAELLPIHDAQLLTYLKLGGYPVGLLLNFNVALVRDGIKRMVSGLEE